MQTSPAFAPQIQTERSSSHDLTSPTVVSQRPLGNVGESVGETVEGSIKGISFAEPFPAVPGPTRHVPIDGQPIEQVQITEDYASRLKQLVGAQPATSSLVAVVAGAIAMSVLRAWSKKKVSRLRSRWTTR